MARWLAETGQRIVVVCSKAATPPARAAPSMPLSRVLNPRQCRVAAFPSPSEREREPMVFPALHSLPAGQGGNDPVRPQLVQSRRRRAGDGLLHARRKSMPSCDRSPNSNGTSSMTESCYSNIGCAATRSGRRSASKTGSSNPLKRWKLSPIDIQARSRYEAYTDARERMLEATHTDFAPWTLVDFNDQALGRLTLVRDFLDRDSRHRPSAQGYRLAAARQASRQGTLWRAPADRRPIRSRLRPRKSPESFD